jgi:hypothetical protein
VYSLAAVAGSERRGQARFEGHDRLVLSTDCFHSRTFAFFHNLFNIVRMTTLCDRKDIV